MKSIEYVTGLCLVALCILIVLLFGDGTHHEREI